MRLALSYDDVLLVPRYSEVLPHDIDISMEIADGITLNVPILSAAMDTVTESHMATAMALNGGVGVIHRNLSIEAQVREVSQVKESLSWIINSPITIEPNTNIRTASKIMEERNIGGLPVVLEGYLHGMITKKDIVLSSTRYDRDAYVSEIMITDLVSYTGSNPSYDEMSELFKTSRVGRIPLVDKNGVLLGLVCINDFSKRLLNEYDHAAVDSNNKLLVGAAVSSHGYLERTQALIDAGVNFIVLDSAHGDSKNVIEAIKGIRSHFPNIVIVGGNVATTEGTEHIIKAGADIVKVGMGPGSICTTRIVTGMGVPQFTAVQQCVEQAEKMGKKVIADGGIRYSGDIAKAIGTGASAVMLGNMLAGLTETPGQQFSSNGRLYKRYRGMGSVSAIEEGSGDRYQFSIGDSIVAEGVDAKVPYKGDLRPFLYQLIVGLKKSMGYCGCQTLKDMIGYKNFIQITNGGIVENHVHDVTDYT